MGKPLRINQNRQDATACARNIVSLLFNSYNKHQILFNCFTFIINITCYEILRITILNDASSNVDFWVLSVLQSKQFRLFLHISRWCGLSVGHIHALCLNRSMNLDVILELHFWVQGSLVKRRSGSLVTHCVRWGPWPREKGKMWRLNLSRSMQLLPVQKWFMIHQVAASMSSLSNYVGPCLCISHLFIRFSLASVLNSAAKCRYFAWFRHVRF